MAKMAKTEKTENTKKIPQPNSKKGTSRAKAVPVVAVLILLLCIAIVAIVLSRRGTGVESGSTLYFGTYEQDNNTENGAEAIEWIVLTTKGNKALVISRYALDCMPFHDTPETATWETCSLRTWLNSDFIDAAFTSWEQTRLTTAAVTADANPEYDTAPGNDTEDRVFLLSIPEAKEYFTEATAGRCYPTDYAVARGVWVSNSPDENDCGFCSWWLRTPGVDPDYAAVVPINEAIGHDGYEVATNDTGVRPAMWLLLDN